LTNLDDRRMIRHDELAVTYGEAMSRFRTMKKKVIELFDEKTGGVVRTICFHSPKEFDEFVKGFKEMRYPGYAWRFKDKGRKKGKNDLLDHHHE
jgi:hypothetical protein